MRVRKSRRMRGRRKRRRTTRNEVIQKWMRLILRKMMGEQEARTFVVERVEASG